MKKLSLVLLAVITATVISTASSAFADEHEHALKVGKKGEVTFDHPTKVGDLTLPAGQYQLQHRVEGQDHLIHFVALGKTNPYYPTTPGVTGHPGEVKCRLEPLGKKAQSTTIWVNQEDDTYRLVKVEVGGENVAHLL